MPEVENWGRTHIATAERVQQVSTEQGVVDAVAQASRSGRRVKPVGALHSWSDIAMDGHTILRLDGLSGVQRGPTSDTMRVRAGTRLKDLNRSLDDVGLAMPILGSVAEQSLAGAVSTGTHGSSTVHQNIAAGVRGARLVTGKGDVLELGPGDPRLDAVRVGLGGLGVLTELTMEVVPAFRLAEAATPMPIEDVLERLPELAHTAEYLKVWWLPHTGMAMVFAAEHTAEPSTYSAIGRWIDEKVVNAVLFSGVLGLGRAVPASIPRLNRLVGLTYFHRQRRVARSHRIFNIAMPPRHQETEYAIPIEATADALRELVPFTREHRVDFVMEVRFVKADAGWMSPAHGRNSCQIGAYMGGSADQAQYFQGFEDRMLALDGRPHWGKQFKAPMATVLQRYPRADDFRELLETLDPERLFANRFIQAIREV